MSSSRISSVDSLRNEAREPKKSVTLIERIFHENPENENVGESEDPEVIVARAERLARENQKMIIGGKRSSKTIGTKREYAQALHRQADLLHQKGDYEAALVLYHRAASACPRETRHGVAARITAAAISSATNPSKSLRKILPGAKNTVSLVGISCTETAAQRAQKIVEESADPVSAIDQILKYFDSRKDILRAPPIFRDPRRSTLVSRSRIMLRQLGSLASVTLENLQVSFASGDFAASLRIGNELLTIAEPLVDRYRYEVAAYHYLAMAQMSLGRHDRAVDQVTLMIRSANKSGDLSLRSRSFMTLGRVHLTFRHLDAAARAWEILARDVKECVPKAWLLHEIGRCYFEMKRYDKALEMSYRCLEYANEGNSRKWLLHGTLLSGQTLVELGRLGEAVMALKKAGTIAENEKDNETHEYVSELIDRITEALKRAVCLDKVFEANSVKDENIAEKNKQRISESEVDVEKSTESIVFKSSRKKSKHFVMESRLKSKITEFRARRIKSSKVLRRNNSRIGRTKTRRKNKIKVVKSLISISPSEESEIFDDGILGENNIDPSDNSDESRDELLSSRTRVIEKRNREDENLTEKEFLLHDEQPSGDGESSNRTGKTYVLDELL